MPELSLRKLLRRRKPAAPRPEQPDDTRTLVFLTGALKGRRIPLEHKLILGRSATRCTVIFPEDLRGVSAVHCTIRRRGATMTITDENSSYGTYVQGVRLIPGHAKILHRGQIITLGSEEQTLTVK